MPTVSVIVPNYNHARFLPKRIESILRQSYQDFELILLDDCSTDNSRPILSSYASDPRVTIEFNEANSGSTFKQWNKGVRLARGKYVWIAESDDYANEHLLEKLVSRLDQDPSAVLCYCRSWRVSADGELCGYWDSYLSHLDARKWTIDFSADGHEECRRYLVHCNTVQSASSVLFRKEVYCQVGGADEKLVLGGDWKTWLSMALAGGTILHVGESLNYCRFHGASVSEKSRQNGVWAAESLQIVDWVLRRVALERIERARVCEELSLLWTPAVLSRRIPIDFRLTILRDAIAVDPHALRKLVRGALTALRLTLARRWHAMRAASAA
jgi:glycosyltransferase involved in cell wall biosynthesis